MKKIKKYTEPPFWDNFIESEPICQSLLENYEEIKKEVFYLKKKANILFANYPAPSIKTKKTNHYFINTKTEWKISPIFGARYDTNARRRSSHLMLIISDIGSFFNRLLCPKTHSILKQGFKDKIVLNAYFTELSPGSIIKPHYHPISNGVHRMNIHLGIICDPDCKITVGEETRTWEEGKILAFKNSGPYRHSVEHKGTKNRIILIVEFDVRYLEQYGIFKGQRIKNEVL
jgi:aspartyl/asparaginyl beta-hydroxylase (cupin superfamily)